MNTPLTKPEIMSPAGYWPQLHAAIEAGADAVYFGLKHFTARAKVGFALSELPDGVFVNRDGLPGLVLEGRVRPWSFEGYSTGYSVDAVSDVDVLTPRSIVAILAAGYQPKMHPSAVR